MKVNFKDVPRKMFPPEYTIIAYKVSEWPIFFRYSFYHLKGKTPNQLRVDDLCTIFYCATKEFRKTNIDTRLAEHEKAEINRIKLDKIKLSEVQALNEKLLALANVVPKSSSDLEKYRKNYFRYGCLIWGICINNCLKIHAPYLIKFFSTFISRIPKDGTQELYSRELETAVSVLSRIESEMKPHYLFEDDRFAWVLLSRTYCTKKQHITQFKKALARLPAYLKQLNESDRGLILKLIAIGQSIYAKCPTLTISLIEGSYSGFTLSAKLIFDNVLLVVNNQPFFLLYQLMCFLGLMAEQEGHTVAEIPRVKEVD